MAEYEVPGFNFRELDELAQEMVRSWEISTNTPTGSETHDTTDESPRALVKKALVKQSGETIRRVSRTGKVYRSQDAAFAGVLESNAIRSNGGFVAPPKSRGVK